MIEEWYTVALCGSPDLDRYRRFLILLGNQFSWLYRKGLEKMPYVVFPEPSGLAHPQPRPLFLQVFNKTSLELGATFFVSEELNGGRAYVCTYVQLA